VFDSVVVVAFQIVFRTKIHANDFFYFLKIIFDISISKRSKKYKLHSILTKKIEIQSKTGSTTEPNRLYDRGFPFRWNYIQVQVSKG